MSNSVQPHRRQPTRLLCPWDSPGKNTGVGCHFLLQCRKVKSESEGVQPCPTLCDPMDCSLPGSSIHGIFVARVLEWVAIAFSRRHTKPTQNPYQECLQSCIHSHQNRTYLVTILCANSVRQQCPVVWSHISPDIAVGVFLYM